MANRRGRRLSVITLYHNVGRRGGVMLIAAFLLHRSGWECMKNAAAAREVKFLM